MVQEFQAFVHHHKLCQKGQPVLLAISGGVDSMVMVDLFDKAGMTFAIAHYNFRLREEEADKDEAFVSKMAKEYNVSLYSNHLNPAQYASEQGISIQMAARELRYNSLENIKNVDNFSAIATAHHRDDSVETVLMNIIKGTGIRGLHGILPKKGSIIRPLMFAFRKDIETYAMENNIQYREDTTNTSFKYERNYLRHQVIPTIEALNPSFRQTMIANISHFHDAENIFNQGLRYYSKKLVQEKDDLIYLPIRKIDQFQASTTILYELLTPYGFAPNQISQIQEVLHEQPGKQFFSKNYRLIKDRSFLIISPRGEKETGPFKISFNRKQLTLREGQLYFQTGPANQIKVKKDPRKAFIDIDLLTFPLMLRRWQEGDYFYPLVDESKGYKPKKKKLKRFFTDQKLSLPEKEDVWLLTSGNRIVWVIGYRLDNRFKVTSKTKTIYKIDWKKK